MAKRLPAIAAAVIGVVALILVLPNLIPQVSNVEAQTIETVVAELTTLSTSIESTGSISAERSIDLSFDASGRIETVLVSVGDQVALGDVLATINTADLEHQVALKEQSLAVQQANYDALLAPPTTQESAQAEANLASAQAQLVSAQSNLEAAPNQNTINCAGLESDQRTLNEAQQDYNTYIAAGYEWDAVFVPDPESSEALALRDAQRAYDVTLAQCQNTSPMSDYEAQVASAQAAVDQAQAALAALNAEPSAEDIASAEAQLEQTRLELENARAALADASLVAPFSGVITSVDIVEGQLVNTSTPVITLQDIARLHINVSVDEMDVAQVNVGQAAIIRPEALNDAEIRGQVTRIAPVGEVSDGIVTFDVRVDLDDSTALPVYVGMTTDVEILLSSEEGVIAVPTEAIQRSGTREFVLVLEATGETRSVDIQTGITVDDMTVILSGVEEGTEIIVPEQAQNNTGFPGPFGG